MSEKIRVLVNGAKGRMGLEIVNTVIDAEDLVLAGETDLGDDLEKIIADSKSDVVVDFTSPHCAYENAQKICASAAAGVIGTTGFTLVQVQSLVDKSKGKKPGIIIAPNFAIGALLMMHCARICAKYMPDVEIIELHHDKKLDAPSGTAIKTAEMISEVRKDVSTRIFESGVRGKLYSDIPLHSIRLPGLLAHQEVIFGAAGQTLTLRHDSINRSCFMPGVLLAIRQVINIEGLVYGLDKLLFKE
ncbi:MAG: 4-hydroxy-tetrahydrodipicolinate reductase [Candidatus Omnitrophota bacterium]